jgi:hypothetical protein
MIKCFRGSFNRITKGMGKIVTITSLMLFMIAPAIVILPSFKQEGFTAGGNCQYVDIGLFNSFSFKP